MEELSITIFQFTNLARCRKSSAVPLPKDTHDSVNPEYWDSVSNAVCQETFNFTLSLSPSFSLSPDGAAVGEG